MRRADRLEIHGPHEQIANMLQALEPMLGEGWSRAHELEARMRETWPGDPPPGFSFHCQESADHPAVDVWVRPAGRDHWELGSVTPLDQWDLTTEQYNAVLKSFHRQLCAIKLSFPEVLADLQPFRLIPEDHLRGETAKLLRRFTRSANKEMTHSNDHRLWLEFIKQVHKEGSYLEPSFLQEWLETEGWQTERAKMLVEEYKLGQELLGVYDEE